MSIALCAKKKCFMAFYRDYLNNAVFGTRGNSSFSNPRYSNTVVVKVIDSSTPLSDALYGHSNQRKFDDLRD